MAVTALDYTKVITDDLKSIPESYLPIVANLVHTFKDSVTYMPPLSESERLALDEGLRQADNGEFVSSEEVTAFFKQWGVNA